MEIAFKFISKYLYFSPKKKHFHKDLRSLLLTALMQNLYYEVKIRIMLLTSPK